MRAGRERADPELCFQSGSDRDNGEQSSSTVSILFVASLPYI